MAVFHVYYDDQCEICQAGVSWLRILDRHGRVRAIPLGSEALPAGLKIEECLRELHVLADHKVLVGWNAVAALARLFPTTWPIGAIGAVPPFSWLGRIVYRAVANNRYALSRCRGGVCGTARPLQVRASSTMGAFWSCRTAGFLLRTPLAAWAWTRSLLQNLRDHRATFRRRIVLLNGRLTLLFLGSATADLVPLIFGERFLAVIYDGLAIDPGSSKMRGSLKRHLDREPAPITAVTATHHHEEHSGNLEWLARRAGVPLFLTALTQARLAALRLPLMRRLVIGQPPAIDGPVTTLGMTVSTAASELQVIPTPGHCGDHVSFYDPREKLLIAGDAFMGSYFSSPNPDVDSIAWIATLESLLATGVEILLEGHGHIHTLRADVPDIPSLVIRQCPREALRAKLDFFHWVRRQIEEGRREGLPPEAIAATCFPWGQRWSWERLGADLTASLLSGGEFSRTELVRSFHRVPDEVLPMIYEIKSRI